MTRGCRHFNKRLQARARREGKRTSDVVREALESYV
jgi:predicted DNA-binding protein